MSPDEIACPYVSPEKVNCAAQAGEDCPDFSPGYHAERIALAASMDRNADMVSREAFERAVEGCGLA